MLVKSKQLQPTKAIGEIFGKVDGQKYVSHQIGLGYKMKSWEEIFGIDNIKTVVFVRYKEPVKVVEGYDNYFSYELAFPEQDLEEVQ